MEYQLIEPRIPLRVELTAVERILTNRGIALAEVKHYLNTTDEDILDPKLIKNIDKGAKMLVSHIAEGHDVMIQIDPDADGFSSAAALLNYLNRLFTAFTQNHISYRLQDGKQHGVIPNTIPNNIKLVIAPDSSSNSYDECK